MNCNETAPLLAAFSDGECDRLRTQRIRLHLLTCTECAAAHEDVLALRARIRNEVPRFRAPAELRAKLSAELGGRMPRATTQTRGERWRWLASGAIAGCAATVLAWLSVTAMLEYRATRDIAFEAVTSHVRATLGHSLVQVASSDQHTVKPWLSARLDYSPPVRDLRDEGFALAGGRIDYLDGRPVATLLYRYREHTIDVFIRPASARFTSTSPRTINGFNIAGATGEGMDWLAVSDVNPATLSGFMQRLVQKATGL